MALDPSATYPGQIDVSDIVGYPYGKAQNVTVAGDGTGTPLEKLWVSDLFGLQQALLVEAGITPSGSPDQADASQYLEAIQAIAQEIATATSNLTVVRHQIVTSQEVVLDYTGVILVHLLMVGGGGAGGYAADTGGGGGGGGGEIFSAWFSASLWPTSLTLNATIGAGGAATSAGDQTNNGTQTSLISDESPAIFQISAAGGVGGAASGSSSGATGGNGGLVTGSTNAGGTAGSSGGSVHQKIAGAGGGGGGNSGSSGGAGGRSAFGARGGVAAASGAVGQGGRGFGAGGGGCANSGGGGGGGGGGGFGAGSGGSPGVLNTGGGAGGPGVMLITLVKGTAVVVP